MDKRATGYTGVLHEQSDGIDDVNPRWHMFSARNSLAAMALAVIGVGSSAAMVMAQPAPAGSPCPSDGLIWTPEEEKAKKAIEDVGGKVVLYYYDEIHQYYPDISPTEFEKNIKRIETADADAALMKTKWGGLMPVDILGRITSEMEAEDTKDAAGKPIRSAVDAMAFKSVIILNSVFSDNDLKKLMGALSKIRHLKKLDLSYTKVGGTNLAILAALPCLKSLDLSSTPVVGSGLCELGMLLTKSSTLKNVWLNGTFLSVPELAKLFRTALTTPHHDSKARKTGINLYLSHVSLFRSTTKGLATYPCPLPAPTSPGPATSIGINEFLQNEFKSDPDGSFFLSGLDLSSTGLTSDGLVSLARILDKEGLTKLLVAGNLLTDLGLASVRAFKGLKTLDLSQNKDVSNSGLVSLGWSSRDLGNFMTKRDYRPTDGLASLESLSLSGLARVTDQGLVWLLWRQQPPNLSKLKLDGTSTFASEGHDLAKQINSFNKLETLTLSKTGVDKDSLKASFRLVWDGHVLVKPFPRLKSLDISSTSVGDKGLLENWGLILSAQNPSFSISLDDPATTRTKLTFQGLVQFKAAVESAGGVPRINALSR